RPALGGARRRLLRAAPADPPGGHPACAPDQQRGTGRRRPRHGRRGGRGEGAPHRRGPRGGRPPPRHARAARLAEGHVASAPRPHRADRRPVSAHAPYHHCRAGLSPARENIMCGILGVVSRSPVNQLLYDGLLLMQHRGQDAAGIATAQNKTFNMHKGNGMVRDVFRTRNMRSLPGNSGIAHVRYPTAGSASNSEEAQPFYVNAPFGITLAHNGNLTNSDELTEQMFLRDRRHINTDSDSEVLLNVFANELQSAASGVRLDASTVFRAVAAVHKRVRGAYAVVAEIAGYGILGFRDPYGIRPLCYGVAETDAGPEYMIASESVALEGTGFRLVRDVQPGEAIFIDLDGNFQSRQCAEAPSLNPCIFEYVYFARPDSLIDGVSVYDARLRMGEYLAETIARQPWASEIDVVMPIPETSRPSAMQLAMKLGLSYREGFFKNHYVGRTFIMPGQAVRKRSVRQK